MQDLPLPFIAHSNHTKVGYSCHPTESDPVGTRFTTSALAPHSSSPKDGSKLDALKLVATEHRSRASARHCPYPSILPSRPDLSRPVDRPAASILVPILEGCPMAGCHDGGWVGAIPRCCPGYSSHLDCFLALLLLLSFTFTYDGRADALEFCQAYGGGQHFDALLLFVANTL